MKKKRKKTKKKHQKKKKKKVVLELYDMRDKEKKIHSRGERTHHTFFFFLQDPKLSLSPQTPTRTAQAHSTHTKSTDNCK